MDKDPFSRQPLRKQLSDHGYPRLGNTVFPSGPGDHLRGAGRDIDDRSPLLAHRLLAAHLPYDRLCKKQHAFCIDPHDPVVTFFRHLQQIHPLLGRYPGVIHQDMDRPEILHDPKDRLLSGTVICDITFIIFIFDSILPQLLYGLAVACLIAGT